MKLSDRIIYEKVDSPASLSPDEQVQAAADPELGRSIRENRAMARLSSDPGPVPDRAVMLGQVYHEAELMEEPRMSLLSRLFEGKRWYAQASLALGLLVVILALAVFLPTDTSLKPQPAWGRTDGYRLNYNLGQTQPNLVHAKLATPGMPLMANVDGGEVSVRTTKTVKVITSDDLSAEELAEIRESLELITDGELEIIALDSFIEGAEVAAGQMMIYITNPDEARIEQIITGALGKAVELDEIHLSIGENGESREITMVISKPEEGIIYLGGEDDSEFIVTLDKLVLETSLTDSLKNIEENLEVLRLDLSELDFEVDGEAIVLGLQATEEGLAAIDLTQLGNELDAETLKEVQIALEEARIGIAAIDLSEIANLADLGELTKLSELEGFQVSGNIEKIATDEITIAMAKIGELKLEELLLTLEHSGQLAEAKDQLKAAMVVICDTENDDIVMKINEAVTIDLREIETALDEYKLVRTGKDGTPIKLETQIVDGELITSICVVGQDKVALDELKIVMSEVMTGLPDPEVTTSTWFYYPDSAATIQQDGMAISVLGHNFSFPEGASADKIQTEIDTWVKANHPDLDLSTSFQVFNGENSDYSKIIVLTDVDGETWSTNYARLEDGNVWITTGEIEEVEGAYSIYVEAGTAEGEHTFLVTTKLDTDDAKDAENDPPKKEKEKEQK